MIEPARNEVVAIFGKAPDEQIENGDAVHALIEVGL